MSSIEEISQTKCKEVFMALTRATVPTSTGLSRAVFGAWCEDLGRAQIALGVVRGSGIDET
jgi:hypothetical protein